MKRDKLKKKQAAGVVTRREMLDWLGSTTVLALGGELLVGCTAQEDGFEYADDRPEGGPVDTDLSCDDASSFSFYPGDKNHSVFDKWGERTVDPQQLQSILAKWQLRVDGLVARPTVFSFADLLTLPRQDQLTDFHCVEGWSVWDVPWNGIHLSELFKLVEPLSSATHVTFHTIGDSYNESWPLEVALEPKSLLAYGVGCSTLPLSHGFPLRGVVPRKWGYKNVKYVYRIELDDELVEGFWVKSGYPYQGDVPPEKLRPGKY